MAVANLNKIDDKLKEMYSAQVTSNPPPVAAFEDKSEILFAQMNFIALSNRRALNL